MSSRQNNLLIHCGLLVKFGAFAFLRCPAEHGLQPGKILIKNSHQTTGSVSTHGNSINVVELRQTSGINVDNVYQVIDIDLALT